MAAPSLPPAVGPPALNLPSQSGVILPLTGCTADLSSPFPPPGPPPFPFHLLLRHQPWPPLYLHMARPGRAQRDPASLLIPDPAWPRGPEHGLQLSFPKFTPSPCCELLQPIQRPLLPSWELGCGRVTPAGPHPSAGCSSPSRASEEELSLRETGRFLTFLSR